MSLFTPYAMRARRHGRGDIGQHFPDTDPRYRGATVACLRQSPSDMKKRGGFAMVMPI